MAVFRPLTPDHKVDLGHVAPPPAAERSLADLLPETPAAAPSPPHAPTAPLGTRAQLAGGVTLALALLLLFFAFGRGGEDAPARPAPPPSIPAPSPAAPPAAPRPPVATLARAVVAYAAPGGAVLGPIEAGRPYTPTERLGAEWTRIAAAGSGSVWVAARELPPDPALPNIATPTAPPRPTSPPAPVVIYVQPAPTRCATVNGGGVSVQRCGSAPLEQLDADAAAEWRQKVSQ